MIDTEALLFGGMAATVLAIPVLAMVAEARSLKAREERRRACFTMDLTPARQRFIRETGVPEAEALAIETEFRRYFHMMSLAPQRIMGLRHGAVDDYWHTLITFTGLYQRYTTAAAGRFIHHDPLAGSAEAYALTYECYGRTFGDDPPARYWPKPDPGPHAAVQDQARKVAERSGSDGGDVWLIAMAADTSGGGPGGGGDGDGGGGGDGGGCGGCG